MGQLIYTSMWSILSVFIHTVLYNLNSNIRVQERQPRVRTSGNPGRSRDIFKPPTPDGDLPPYSPSLT